MHRPLRAGPVVWLIILGALVLNLGLVLTHDNHLGVDGGAYLISRNYVLGDEPTGAGFPRPPLAPGYLLVPFTSALGDDVGFKVWSALSAIAPLLAVYLLSGIFLTPWQRVVTVAFVAVDIQITDMMVTGALPLLGFSLILTAFWAILRLEGWRDWRHGLVLGTCVALVPFVNQTSAGLAALLLPIFVLSLAVFRGPGIIKGVVPAALLGGLLALTALPWYIAIAPNSELLHYPGPWVYLIHWNDAAWFLCFIGLPTGLYLVWKGTQPAIRALGVLVAVEAVLLVLLSTDETIINIFYRSRYLIMLLFWPSVVWAISQHRSNHLRWLFNGAIVVLIGLLGYGSIWSFYNQASYSDMITAPTAEALAMLREEAPGEGIISNAFTMSLWVAGLNKVESPHPWTWEPPRAYTETDAQVRCILGWVDGCDWHVAQQFLGVNWVLVDERFPFYSGRAPANYLAPPDQWQVTASAPWLEPVYSKSTTRLWRINGGM